MRGIGRFYIAIACVTFTAMLAAAAFLGAATWLMPEWAQDVGRQMAEGIARLAEGDRDAPAALAPGTKGGDVPEPAPARTTPSAWREPEVGATVPPAGATAPPRSPRSGFSPRNLSANGGEAPVAGLRAAARIKSEAESSSLRPASFRELDGGVGESAGGGVGGGVGGLESTLSRLESDLARWRGISSDGGPPEAQRRAEETVDAWELLRQPLSDLLRSLAAPEAAALQEKGDIRDLGESIAARLDALARARAASTEALLSRLEPKALAWLLEEEGALSDLEALECLRRLQPARAAEVLDRLSRLAPRRAAALLRAVNALAASDAVPRAESGITRGRPGDGLEGCLLEARPAVFPSLAERPGRMGRGHEPALRDDGPR